jgi:hypothetical protein
MSGMRGTRPCCGVGEVGKVRCVNSDHADYPLGLKPAPMGKAGGDTRSKGSRIDLLHAMREAASLHGLAEDLS